MADAKKTIEFLFKGVDELGPVVDSVTGDVEGVAHAAEGAFAPIGDLAFTILKLDAAFAALAGGALTFAFMKMKDFESASVNLEKILGDQRDMIGFAEEAVMDLSATYGRSSVQFLESVTNFKKAGFDLEESIMLTEKSIGLVIAGAEAGLDVALSTELIISSLKGFKAPAEDAARLTDVLNKVANEYATSVTQLGIGMSKLSPVAHKMGFSFEETAGILVPVIEIFRSGDEAAVALRTGLLKLISDTKPVEEALASIGVAQRDVNGVLRSGKDILTDVGIAFQTAEESEKLFLAAELVGIRQGAKMVEVFDGLARSAEITATGMSATGSVLLEVAAKSVTAEYAWNRLSVSVDNVAIVMGERFGEGAVSAIDGLTKISLAIQESLDKGHFDAIFDVISEWGDDLGKLFSQIAENMPKAFAGIDFRDLVHSLGLVEHELKLVFQTLFGDVDLTTISGLRQVIQDVVDTISSFLAVSAGVFHGFTILIEALREMRDAFNELDPETKEFLGDILVIAHDIALVGGAVAITAGIIKGFTLLLGVMAGPGGVAGLGAALALFAPQITLMLTAWAAWEVGGQIGTWAADNIGWFGNMTDAIGDWMIRLDLSGEMQKGVNLITKDATEFTKEQTAWIKARNEELAKAPETIETEIKILTPSESAEETKMLKFIVANSDAGMTTNEILASLKVEYADDESKDTAYWLQKEEEIQKWVGINIDDAGVKDTIQNIFGASEDGVVSFPGQIYFPNLSEADAELSDWINETRELGLTVSIPGFEDSMKNIEGVTRTTFEAMGGHVHNFTGEFGEAKTIWTTVNDEIVGYWSDGINIMSGHFHKFVDELGNEDLKFFEGLDDEIEEIKDGFRGIGGVMGDIKKEHGVWTAVWTADPNSIIDSAEEVKDTITDLEAEALKSKETIATALKFRAEVNIAEFEAQTDQLLIRADLLRDHLKWKAEIDLASLEVVKTNLDTINTGLETSASIIETAFDSLGDIKADFGPFSEQMSAALRSIEEETEARKREVDMLEKLTEAQVEYLQAKTESINSGDALITIEADGMEPHIEAFMWEILSKIQMRAAENADEFLLGL